MDWPAAYTPNSGPMDSFVLVQLKKGAGTGSLEYVEELRSRLRRKFPGVEFAFDTGGILTAALNFGLPSPINIQVKGSQLEISHEIAQTIVREIRDLEGVRDARVYQRMDYPVIEVDRIKSANLGVDQDTVVKNIVTTLNSSVNFKPSFWIDEKNGNHYFIGAQYPESDIHSLETLENIPINSDTGKPVLIKNIADFSRATAPATVTHHNITRVVDIYVNVQQADVGTVAARIEDKIANAPSIREKMAKYREKGYSVNVRGEYQSMKESFSQFGQGLAIAALLVYLVLVAQFRSLLDPLLIMIAVPLGFIGIALALYLSDTDINIPVFMGMIMTVGRVVEYNVLLVEFANKLQDEGMTREQVILNAARTHLIPILMTSLTTILALLPMAADIGGMGGANQPLALAMLGGVVGAFILSLLVMPSLYTVIGSKRTAKTVATKTIP